MQCGDKSIDLSKPVIMGILNVTPDSFSDGGKHSSLDDAVNRAWKMIEEGAHIIDIGGESTRPGAQSVASDEECRRVIPVIKALRDLPAVISVDTSKAAVIDKAAAAGAGMINDVRALREPGALAAAAASELPVVLMHMKGAPRTMQSSPHYEDVVEEVSSFLRSRLQTAADAGISSDRVILDPGIGFGKTLEHNLVLMRNIRRLSVNQPLMVGVSRKSLFGDLLGRPIQERLSASLSASCFLRMRGVAIFRVHDVQATSDALNVFETLFVSGAGCN